MNGQVVVRASFPQGWHDNRYDKGEIMPANEKQAQRLTQSGQGYYDFLPDESLEKPTMSNTKKEIEEYLDETGIEYDEYATKSELLELIDGQ